MKGSLKSGDLARDILASLLSGFRGDLEGVVLFGSIARDEARPRSDVDLLIFTKGGGGDVQHELQAYLALKPIRAKYKVDTTVLTLDLKEIRDVTPFLINVAHDGLILSDPYGRVSELFREIKRAVKEAGLIRYEVGHAYGWKPKRRLKPGENIRIELRTHGAS